MPEGWFPPCNSDHRPEAASLRGLLAAPLSSSTWGHLDVGHGALSGSLTGCTSLQQTSHDLNGFRELEGLSAAFPACRAKADGEVVPSTLAGDCARVCVLGGAARFHNYAGSTIREVVS